MKPFFFLFPFFLACLCSLLVAGVPHEDNDPIGPEPDVFECGRAAAVRAECFAYLSGTEPKPSPSCCNGVKTILQMLAKPDDKLLGCRCLKEASSYFHTIKENAMSDLSKACNLDPTLFSADVCHNLN